MCEDEKEDEEQGSGRTGGLASQAANHAFVGRPLSR